MAMTDLSPADLQAIRARQLIVGDKPWYVMPGDSVLEIHKNTGRFAAVQTQLYWKKFTEEDRALADYIAESPDMIALLLAHVDKQAAEIERLRQLASGKRVKTPMTNFGKVTYD